jgi:hypothetical protein
VVLSQSHSLAVSSPRGIRLFPILFVIIAGFCGFSAKANAASGPHLAVSPEILDFQTVIVGQQATQLCHIQNTGSANVLIYSVSSSRSEFQPTGPILPVSLAPAESIDFNVTFEPTTSGKASAVLEIASSAQAMQSYTLTGIGQSVAGGLQLSPSSLNFGLQSVDSLTTRNVTLSNNGEVPVTISGVSVMGSGFAFSNVSPGLTLAPKQHATVQVSFQPSSDSEASGRLVILSKDLGAAATLPLVGSGVIPAPTRSSPALMTAAFTLRTSVASPTAAPLATSAASTTLASATMVTRTAAVATSTATSTAFAVPASSASTIHPALTTGSASKTVLLQWGASPSPVAGYRVYRGSVTGGPYADQTSGALPALNYSDNSVNAGSTYYYVVTSIDASGVESAYSNEAKAVVPSSGGTGTTTTPPPATGAVPTSLTSGMAMNGSAALNGSKLRLTNTGSNLAGSGWFTTPVNIQSFSTTFTFQITNTNSNPIGNGLTFVLQNAGTKAVGPSGGGLGYGPDQASNPSPSSNTPIAKSVAVKFDTVNNAGEGTNSTGLYINGASPTMPATTLGGGINLRSGDLFMVVISYDGTKLKMVITDTANTSQTCTSSWLVNIPGIVGGNTAYVGFTGSTGNSVSNQDIVSWTYGSNTTTTPPTTSKTPIVYKSTALPVVSSGPVFRTFAYAAFPDGNGTILDATKAGDNVTFTVNVPSAGTYDLKLSYKQYSSRGISQLSINGTSMGAPLDQYLAQEGYATFDYGNFTFSGAGNYAFKFTILGKDASASGYGVSFDDFTLTPQ